MAAFHAQQVAEKAIKALLTAAQVPFQRDHDVSLLVNRVPRKRFPRIHEVRGLATPNPYAVATRYPMIHAGNPNERQRWRGVERR